jgi:branched-chain amino acid transport system substrate-binding protein
MFTRAVMGFLCLGWTAVPASAEIASPSIRIGVLTDLSGGYEQNSGFGVVEATRMAVEDEGGKINGTPVEVLQGDHQNKPDIGAALAARWFDVEKVDAVVDLVNSAVAFAVLDLAKAKNKTVLLTSAGSADFTGKACAPDNAVHWVYDTYQIGKSIGKAVPLLGKSWFIISADYAFGYALEGAITEAVQSAGAKVLGKIRAPLGTTDFSSYILQAQASKAEVVVFANGGDDTLNAMKAAREFGLAKAGQKIVPLGLDSLPAIKSVGLDVAQDGWGVTTWWSDINKESEDFTRRFAARRKTAPSSFQAGTYSAVRAYLQAVRRTNSSDPKVVIADMRKQTIRDAFTNQGKLRPDGRMVHDVFVVQVKKPEDSRNEWDLVKLIATIPGDEAFRPLSDAACPALQK